AVAGVPGSRIGGFPLRDLYRTLRRIGYGWPGCIQQRITDAAGKPRSAARSGRERSGLGRGNACPGAVSRVFRSPLRTRRRARGVKAAWLRRIGALRGRIVTAFHSDDIVCYPRRFRGNVYAPLFAEGDLFLPESNRGKEELLAMGCPAARLRVHRMGVDMRRFPTPVRHQTRGSLTILTVARLVEKKGIADAIQAVAGLAVP